MKKKAKAAPPPKIKKGASMDGSQPTVDQLRDKLRSIEEDHTRQAAETERLRQKGEQLLHQLEAARETISNLRGQLHSGSTTDELDLEPVLEEDDLLDADDPTYDFDSVGEDLHLLESRRRELDQARLEQELEQEGQTFWNICPKCGEGLEEFEFGGIKADRCETCGATLFERSEIELLLSVRPAGEILNRLQMLART
ncbi:MAG: zf-TFIIB domain-containing protein [Candidatus Eisenbacteria bacterium]|uniref:Zf-TFIIB domain-containing protein n=1 Tax=Eiseniibacteriota bacterium TaxID=2212470 RepID=A0A948RU49_UNCEI|nr:zf-TFIIB domain-containing protein [Candidatus Eisenbacteria bacterium]MBU1950156.1 zf-TFIIB domain-containing protein [Candidatus Eisenbacteria bacterium]MBU2689608.1 zf-TFIIB domain-containing protein [Candidatus Eisenbacteria bacterium]